MATYASICAKSAFTNGIHLCMTTVGSAFHHYTFIKKTKKLIFTFCLQFDQLSIFADLTQLWYGRVIYTPNYPHYILQKFFYAPARLQLTLLDYQLRTAVGQKFNLLYKGQFFSKSFLRTLIKVFL